MKKKKALVFLGVIIFLLVLFRWNAVTHSTIAVVKVVEVHEKAIKVQKTDGQLETIQIPKGIYKLIAVNQEYFITYEHRKWERPTLVSIEP